MFCLMNLSRCCQLCQYTLRTHLHIAHKVFYASEGITFTWDEGCTQDQIEFTARGNRTTKRK